jgi:hypothetical protein
MSGVGSIFHGLGQDCIAVVVVEYKDVFVPLLKVVLLKWAVKPVETSPVMLVTAAKTQCVRLLGLSDGGLETVSVFGILDCVEWVFFCC